MTCFLLLGPCKSSILAFKGRPSVFKYDGNRLDRRRERSGVEGSTLDDLSVSIVGDDSVHDIGLDDSLKRELKHTGVANGNSVGVTGGLDDAGERAQEHRPQRKRPIF